MPRVSRLLDGPPPFPERGDLAHWRLDAYQLELPTDPHWLALEVSALGARDPKWQVPIPAGLLVIAEDPFAKQVSTGHAPWEAAPLAAVTFVQRSDCHPWGAHPLYHIVATLAGLRPAARGFSAVELAPLVNIPLRRLALTVPHPRGELVLDLHRPACDAAWQGTLRLPAGITAVAPPGIVVG
jgi:hypothetical protein